MGWFDWFRKRAGREPSVDEIVDQAHGGDSQGALVAVEAKVDAVRRRAGASSPAYAAALFEQARVFMVLGMADRATDLLRAASAIDAPSREDEKNRLTYLMNLGEALALSGRFDEAAAVAARGLEARASFYGREHPGFAYGLESAADIALAVGRHDDALASARAAVAIYRSSGHQQLPHARALAVLAQAGATGGAGELAMDPDMNPEMAAAVLTCVAERALPVAPATQLAATEALAPLVRDADCLLRAWAAVEARARPARDCAAWGAALLRVRAIADERAGERGDERGDRALAIDAELGLVMCHDAAGDHAAAVAACARAEQRARDAGAPDALCKVLRNAGLYRVQREADVGLTLLRAAAAVPGAPPDELARSQMALGINLQHRGELDQARDLLAAGLAAIDAADLDAVCARSHLHAIEAKGGCGCGDTGAELYAQVERVIRARLPPDLVQAIHFAEGRVSIHATRALDPREARLFADTVDLAMAELRERIAREYA